MNSDRISTYAAAQSVTEISIGSVLHAFHVPLGGHLLSLNQALILSFACKGVPSRREGVRTACGVSNVAALLKSLSPVGDRLSPMLAICAQGVLFALGVGLLGANIAGILLGAILLSVWAFLHPLLMAYFLFGGRFFEAAEKLWTGLAAVIGWKAQTGLWILAAFVGIKLVLSGAIAAVGWTSSSRLEARYFAFIENWRKPRAPEPAPTAGRSILKDLLSPLFLLSFAMSVGFFVLERNATAAQATVYILRVLGIAVLASWILRLLPVSSILKRLQA